QIAMQKAGLSEVRGQQTGILPARTVEPETEYTIEAPDGSQSQVRSSVDGLLSGIAAPEIGRYKIRDGSTVLASIGVSLLTVSETSLATIDQLQFRDLKVSASGELLKTDRPLWPIFAAAGFVLLLAEWWLFQRRPVRALPTR